MAGRPELAAALEDLDRGNELVIAEWDRATRSMWDGLQVIKAARLPTALRSASWFCILRRRRSSTARMQTGGTIFLRTNRLTFSDSNSEQGKRRDEGGILSPASCLRLARKR